jgi:hypothetical protein
MMRRALYTFSYLGCVPLSRSCRVHISGLLCEDFTALLIPRDPIFGWRATLYGFAGMGIREGVFDFSLSALAFDGASIFIL